jgi:hypothetical protein
MRKTMAVSYLSVISKIFFGLLLVALVSGQKRFIVWSQITDIYQSRIVRVDKIYYCKSVVEQKFYGYHHLFDFEAKPATEECKADYIPPVQVFERHHVFTELSQSVRGAIFFPLVMIGQYSGVSLHVLFSAICCGLILLSSLALSSCFIDRAQECFMRHSSLLILCGLSFFMNGRVLLSFLAGSIYVFATKMVAESDLARFKPLKYFSLIFSVIIFSQISTGVSFIFLLLVFLHLFKIFPSRFFSLKSKILFTLLFVVQSFLATVGVIKNYLFFQGENISETFMGFLGHGFGRYFSASSSGMLLAVIFGAFLAFAWKSRRYFDDPVILGALFFVVGGLFGRTVFVNVIPFALYLSVRFYFRKARIGAQ